MSVPPRAPVPLWRIRDRSTFAALRAEGRRVRRGPVAVTFLVDGAGDPPRVAYAVGRKVGPAVVRNRVRRRLRATVAELHTGPAGPLPSGAYLVSASPSAAALPPSDLKESLSRAMHEVSS